MDWYQAHLTALSCVTPTMARGFFRGCGIDGCEKETDEHDNEKSYQEEFAVSMAINAAST